MKEGNSISLLMVFMSENRMSHIGFHAPISCATQRNALWSHTKREGFTEIHPSNNYNETSYRIERSSTHGVGPQNTEKEKTCNTANAIKTSPGKTFNENPSPQCEKYSPPCLFCLVSKSLAVPVGARVKWPTKPA